MSNDDETECLLTSSSCELDLTEKGFFDGINKAISSGWFRGGIEGAEVTESRVRVG